MNHPDGIKKLKCNLSRGEAPAILETALMRTMNQIAREYELTYADVLGVMDVCKAKIVACAIAGQDET